MLIAIAALEGGTVVEDADGDGVRGAGEAGLATVVSWEGEVFARTHSDGTFTLELPEGAPEGGLVIAEAEREPHALVLRVLDNGPGIPPSDLTRVFERFYRVDKSRSRAPGGTGIGLAIVKHLVELLGGTVTAGSRDEGGAVFTVRLPQPS